MPNLDRLSMQVRTATIRDLRWSAAAGRWLLRVLALHGLALHGLTARTAAAEMVHPAETLTAAGTTQGIYLPDWEERIVPFAPRVPESLAEQDRVTAASLFAQAQLHLRRNEQHAAWHCLARAHRLDPASPTIALQLIRAVYDAQRRDVAVSYALKLPDQFPIDPLLWPQLATHLADQSRWDDAIRIYQQALRYQTMGTTPAGSSSNLASPARRLPDPRTVILNYQLGRLHYLAGRPQEAAAAYRHVLAALEEPDQYGLDQSIRDILVGSPGAWSFLAESFLQSEDFVTAEALFRKELARPRRDDLEPLFQARLAAAQGRHAEALQLIAPHIERAGDAWGETPYLLYLRLSLLTQPEEGRPIDRRSLCQKVEAAVVKNPRMTEVAHLLATEYQTAGDLGAAERVWRTIGAWPELAHAQIQRQDWPAVADTLAKIASEFGHLETVRNSLDAIREHREALAAIDAAWTITPTWQQHLAAGWLSTIVTPDQIDTDRFLAAYQALLTQPQELATPPTSDKPSAENSAESSAENNAEGNALSWGLDLLIGGFHATGLTLLDQVVAHPVSSDRRPYLYFYRSLLLEAMDRMPESRLAAHAALGLAPDQPELIAHWGWCLYRDGLYAEAERVYRSLLHRFDADYNSTAELRDRLRGARLTLSSLALNRRDLAEAEQQLEMVLDEYPADIGAMNDLAYIWADQGKNLHRVLPMAQWVVQAEPRNPAYRDTLGWTLLRLGRWDEAVQQLEQAVALTNPPVSVITDHYGDALWAAGRTDEARQAWGRALEQLSDAPEAAARLRQKLSERIAPTPAEKR